MLISKYLPETTKFADINVPPHIISYWFVSFILYMPTFQGADPYLAGLPLVISGVFGLYILPHSKTTYLLINQYRIVDTTRILYALEIHVYI